VVYDVTFALVWADQDAALNRNEAYALASCRDCRTVAVAFQVVLLVGSVDVVVPQNLAAAVNYACVECVTYALATQLVVTLDGPLSDDGARDLAAIWADLAEFGEQIDGVPLAELRDRLTEFETRILAVVRADAEPSAADSTEAAPEGADPSDDGAGPTASTAPTGAAGTAGAGTSTTPTGAGATGTASPSDPATSGSATSGSASAGTTSPAPASSEPVVSTSAEPTPSG
jgi:putative peptide zinc metalloprotease protein